VWPQLRGQGAREVVHRSFRGAVERVVGDTDDAVDRTDDQDAAIFPATTPVTLSYVSASSGIYRGVFTDSFDPPVGPGYYLKIVVSTPSAANRTFKRPAYVVEDE